MPSRFRSRARRSRAGLDRGRQRPAQGERRDGRRQLGHLEGQAQRHRARRAAVRRACRRATAIRLHGAPDLFGRQRRRAGPAPRARTRPRRASGGREASSSGGGSDSSKTIAIIALVVGGARPARRRRRAALAGGARHEDRRAGGRAARRSGGRDGAAGDGVGTRVAARDATPGERRALPTAHPGEPHLQRAHRAALRSHLGHGCPRQPGDGREPGAVA